MSTTTTRFKLIAGRPCLDFVNTLNGRLGEAPQRDLLATYADLVAWAHQAGLVSDVEAQRLRRLAAEQPEAATAVLARAKELREAFFALVACTLEGRPLADEDLAVLNAALPPALAAAQLVPAQGRFALATACDTPEAVLWPLTRSMAELLTSDALGRVRFCEGYHIGDCAWLFLDESRNHTRRWCDMKDCGNRAKARRHYHKTRRAP